MNIVVRLKMKKIITGIILAILLLILVIGIFQVLLIGWMNRSITQYERDNWHRFQSLIKTNDHKAVLNAAIPLIRSATNQVHLQKTELSSLPQQISGMSPNYVSIYPAGMSLELHGGFDHYGFLIYMYETEWKMFWYTEKEKHLLLSHPLNNEK